MGVQLSLFEETQDNEYFSKYDNKSFSNEDDLFSYYNKINSDKDHFTSNDDICTPMECVKVMIDYIPNEIWLRKDLKILDPCCGNGNFGAYCKFKTSIDNIISFLRKNNVIERVWSNKTGYWKVNE